MAGLADLLYGSIGDEKSYYASDPFVLSGLNIAKTPISTEGYGSAAYVVPFLQSALGGALVGYGKQHAADTAYKEYRPIFQALTGGATYRRPTADYGPLTQEDAAKAALVDFSSPERPDGWSIKMGQGAIMQALQQRQLQDAYQQKMLEKQAETAELFSPNRIALEAMKAGAIEQAKTDARNGGSADGALRGVPAKLRSQAITEAGKVDANNSVRSTVADAYETTKDVGAISQFIPLATDKSRFEAARASILSSLQAIWKGPMSDPDMERIEPLLPSKWDRDSQIEIKKQRMDKLIQAQMGGTPVLDMLGLDTGKGAATSAPTPPAGFELTGNRDANGNWGIRRIAK